MQKCPRCMREFSDEIGVCPHCGCIVGTQANVRSHPASGTVGQSGTGKRSLAIRITAVVLTVAVAVSAAVLFGVRSKQDNGASTTQSASQQAEAGVSAPAASVAETEMQTAVTCSALSRSQAAKLYTDYLKARKYKELVADYDDEEYEYEAESALADINDDGIPELLIRVTNKSCLGLRGYASATLLLGMRNGKVESMGYAEFGGGSGGGDYMNFKYDTQTKKHVLEYKQLLRDGGWAHAGILSYFDTGRFESGDTKYSIDGYVKYKCAHRLRCDVFTIEGPYAENAQEVLRDNHHAKHGDGCVVSYMFDDAYISEAEYHAINERFIEPTDRAFQMKPVTLENPIPAE